MNSSIDTASDTDARLADWQIKDAAYKKLLDAVRPRNKDALFDVLAAAGITLVQVAFDGYGDSGQIERIEVLNGDATVDMRAGEIEITRARWGLAEPERSTASIGETIELLAYDFLADTHAGWENNEGAFGEFTFDVAARTITLDYNERIETSDYSQHVF